MSISDQPLVSVLMTAYNREKFIAEAIESVLASTFEHFELIIVDDCSSDNTVKIAKEFESKDQRIKVYVNEENLGQFPNRNNASSFARGKYMMSVDSDDKILQNALEQLVDVMETHPESSFAMYSHNSEEIEILDSKDAINQHFFKNPFLNCGPGGTFLTRFFFEEIGKYPIEYGIPGDMFFNLKACCFSSIILIPFEFMYYRRHDDQEINNSYDYLYNNYKYMRDALSLLPLPISSHQNKWLGKKNKRRFTMNIIKYYLKTFDLKRTRKAISLANFHIKDAIIGIFHFR